jgi:hypothetical protein
MSRRGDVIRVQIPFYDRAAPMPGYGVLSVSTGHGAERTTCSATLPMSRRPNPVRPCVPITIKSQLLFFARFTNLGSGNPFQQDVLDGVVFLGGFQLLQPFAQRLRASLGFEHVAVG